MIPMGEEKLKQFLRDKGYAGIILRTRANFSWVTGGKVNHIVNTTDTGVADLVLFKERKFCVTSKMESRRIMEEELAGLGYELIETEWYEDPFEEVVRLCDGRRMAADTDIDGAVNVAEELAGIRSTLTTEEMKSYRALGQAAAQAVESVAREIKPGMTEYDVQALIAARVMPQGINPQVILVATDDRIFNYRHPIPTRKKLEKYAMIVLCAERGGLVANVTRFVHFGELPARIAENKEKLAVIDVTMNAESRPGTKVSDVFNAGVAAYEDAGFPDDWRLLHQGGPTGYASREYLASMNTHDVIKVNQAFAWNPAIRGIKSEDTVLVGEEANEFLTHTGGWPYIEVEYEGGLYHRPDILIR
ncbi:peptidase M24 [Alteribacter lacisalsi]|uniref:Peptidase M24 n=1 Tax=Alteribacter lacisalsi TaxID=2045244 RepID=A0A2W0H6P2_9BACI|nr:M24 family metallopeptidase [Alteribacter lacisalsi]PYZ97533.1 peptidase M24 [Alteribacter lacisalsi]